MHPEVDHYVLNAKKWQAEMEQLRAILLDTPLQENYKWKAPCYTYKKKNIVIIGDFKAACTLGFFKGALLKDAAGVLVKPGENSQSTRMFKFTSVQEIIKQEPLIRAYINEAIEVEKAGLKVPTKHVTEFELPEELKQQFNVDSLLEAAFNNLTPGRQKGYLLHFNGAKQSQTRMNRIEKYIERIKNGKGIHDCVCGHSKRMPSCDGSHKYL